MKRLFLAATAALALVACSDAGPMESNARIGDPRAYIVEIPDSIFTGQVPGSTLFASPGWEVGTVFTLDDSSRVKGFRYYKAVGETGSHTARLWRMSPGPTTLMASRAFTNETSSGWQKTMLSTTVSIPAGTYVVSVNTNTYQVKTGGYFNDNGPIYRSHLVATGGRYGQPTGSFPSSGSTSAFFVDLIYSPRLCNPDVDFPCP
jgi:hypothetical protein